ncbi:MAG: class 1 isoprenoid biosynthesis enzyme [Vicinamibacterales bacterium]
MTLSPVFRSDEAVQILRTAGVWSRLDPAARGQAEAITTVKQDLPSVLDNRYIDLGGLVEDPQARIGIEFVQEFFFLIVFRSVLQTVGLTPADLRLCCELNFCIKGTITAADNLFDDQDKALLPLKLGQGARFRSILQLLAFERLVSRVLERGVTAGSISTASAAQFQKELLSRMAAIGSLEGSEEGGVQGVMEPDQMIEQVHRVRGGALFELAFIAPRLLEAAVNPDVLARAQRAISKLGTAFQIVDDLTDFEFDLNRGSHNLLVSQITHRGTAAERTHLATFSGTAADGGDVVTELFADSARAVVERGEDEAKRALDELRSLGFWFPTELSHELVRAIVGLDGVDRMRTL